MKYITNRELPLEVMKIQKALSNLGQFSVVDGCLYFIDPGNHDLRLVVPEKYRKEIFHESHAGPIGSHACGQRIYDQLRRKFFWTNMRADCVKWSLSCPICAFCLEPRKNTPPLQPIVVTRPFELVCLDILQLGLTPDGNKYALVIVDHFTKYLIAVPLRTKSADEVARAFVERVLLV